MDSSIVTKPTEVTASQEISGKTVGSPATSPTAAQKEAVATTVAAIKKVKKSNKCAHSHTAKTADGTVTKVNCTLAPAKIVGDCRYCLKKFCAKHRLPEAHACAGINECREIACKKLGDRLLGEKCVGSKVSG